MSKKIKKFNKKTLAVILVLLTLVGSIIPIVNAVSGSGQWVGAQYSSGFTTTSNSGSGGILIRRLENRSTGERHTVFCAEHGVAFPTGVWENGSYYTPTDSTVKLACKVAYFGWYSKHGNYIVDGGILDDSWAYDTRLDYVFTQQMVWETLGQDYGTFLNSTVQARYIAFKDDVNAKINNMQLKPSFNGGSYELNVGDTITLTDTNNVLKDYQSIDRTESGIRFQHTQGQNTLTITITNSCTIENYYLTNSIAESLGLVKADSIDHDTTIYFDFGSLQNQIYSMHYNDPIPLALNLKINAKGHLEVIKNSEDGMIAGVQFRLYGTAINGTYINEYATTDSTGKARFQDILISGANGYTVEEVRNTK